MKSIRVVFAVAAVAAAVAGFIACGGSGSNPVNPAGLTANNPPTISAIQLLKDGTTPLAVVGFGQSALVRVEVRDPENDAVSCRYTTVAGGKVFLAGDNPGGCNGATYIAPDSGGSDQINITATDSKGAGSSSVATFIVGPQSVAIGGEIVSTPSPAPSNPNPKPTPTPTTGGGNHEDPPSWGGTPPPGPAPTPTPTPKPNQRPTVTLSGGGSCYPNCNVAFTAAGSDPEDGTNLKYTWDGCCAGSNGTNGQCGMDKPGDFSCTVTVEDKGGLTASATKSAKATNAKPNVSCPEWINAASNGDVFVNGGNNDERTSALECKGSVASGPAHASLDIVNCGSIWNGWAHAQRCSGCSEDVSITVTDEWGLSATCTFSIDTP